MSMLNPDMQQWLRDSRENYEFYLLHAIFHDPLRRASLLATPITEDDFQREEFSLVIGGIIRAKIVMSILGRQLPAPPSEELLRTYVESAGRSEGSDDEAINDAMRLVRELQDPKFIEMYHVVNPYFEAWYGSIRAKKVARKILMDEVPDAHDAVSKIQVALAAAAQAAVTEEDNPMSQFLYGETLDREARRSSGIAGLDGCLNGGWGSGECYLLFGGTGSGKSLSAGQCAWHEAAANKGYPLIVSTELLPREYCARIISHACSVPINILQDCENAAQIRQEVSGTPELMLKLKSVDESLETIKERVRIAKVSAEEGMDARAVLEREVLRYEQEIGHKPTWVCLDWLGSVADQGPSGKNGTSERAMAWEMSANSCVKFAEDSGIPTLVLAQAVNDAQLMPVLTINDIGISKGIGKSMVAVIGVTNAMDKAGVAAATKGKADMPRSMILEDQFFCVCKSRKGEGRNIPVTRNFLYQRFEAKEPNI